jgi:hypothetical protein
MTIIAPVIKAMEQKEKNYKLINFVQKTYIYNTTLFVQPNDRMKSGLGLNAVHLCSPIVLLCETDHEMWFGGASIDVNLLSIAASMRSNRTV